MSSGDKKTTSTGTKRRADEALGTSEDEDAAGDASDGKDSTGKRARVTATAQPSTAAPPPSSFVFLLSDAVAQSLLNAISKNNAKLFGANKVNGNRSDLLRLVQFAGGNVNNALSTIQALAETITTPFASFEAFLWAIRALYAEQQFSNQATSTLLSALQEVKRLCGKEFAMFDIHQLRGLAFHLMLQGFLPRPLPSDPPLHKWSRNDICKAVQDALRNQGNKALVPSDDIVLRPAPTLASVYAPSEFNSDTRNVPEWIQSRGATIFSDEKTGIMRYPWTLSSGNTYDYPTIEFYAQSEGKVKEPVAQRDVEDISFNNKHLLKAIRDWVSHNSGYTFDEMAARTERLGNYLPKDALAMETDAGTWQLYYTPPVGAFGVLPQRTRLKSGDTIQLSRPANESKAAPFNWILNPLENVYGSYPRTLVVSDTTDPTDHNVHLVVYNLGSRTWPVSIPVSDSEWGQIRERFQLDNEKLKRGKTWNDETKAEWLDTKEAPKGAYFLGWEPLFPSGARGEDSKSKQLTFQMFQQDPMSLRKFRDVPLNEGDVDIRDHFDIEAFAKTYQLKHLDSRITITVNPPPAPIMQQQQQQQQQQASFPAGSGGLLTFRQGLGGTPSSSSSSSGSGRTYIVV